jgi:hypothetical protein
LVLLLHATTPALRWQYSAYVSFVTGLYATTVADGLASYALTTFRAKGQLVKALTVMFPHCLY